MRHPRPYPGMRPFERNEADLFFGQEDHVAELVSRLGRSRIVAVVGDSGCGKSSMVKAGMIPTLDGNRPAEASLWRISVSQPGTAPIRQLAEGVARAICRSDDVAGVESLLRGSEYGLVDVIQSAGLPKGHRALIVIDQFEELFRLWRESSAVRDRDEAELFVKLLLAVGEVKRETAVVPTYVTLTMRSEYLGDCALFFGLAEAINNGAFLLPKMSRANVTAAITRPLEAFNGTIENDALQELLNESVIAGPDGLPLLQHGLRRLWELAIERPGSPRITLNDLKSVDPSTPGTLYLEKHLNAHLDGLLATKLSRAQAPIAPRLFKQLGEYDAKRRLIRVRCQLVDAAAVCSASEDDLLGIVDAFRDHASGQSFLTPPLERTHELRQGIDSLSICHEALLRHWITLGRWIDEETADAEQYRAIAARAVAVARPGALSHSEIRRAFALRKRVLTEPWSRRYRGAYQPDLERYEYDYGAAIAFVKRSNRTRWFQAALLALPVVAVVSTGISLVVAQEARKDRELQEQRASENEDSARKLGIANRKLGIANGELQAKVDELDRTNRDKDLIGSKLQIAVAELTQSQAQLTSALAETKQAMNQQTAARQQAESARADAEQQRLRAEFAGEQREEAFQMLRDETQKNLEAAARHDAEQNLRILAARPLQFAPELTRAQLEDLLRPSQAYAAKYRELPAEITGALARAVAASFLERSDLKTGDPALAVMPNLDTPTGLLTIRRGTLGTEPEVSVRRDAWSVQRAAVDTNTGELFVAGAGGFAAIAPTKSSMAITRKLHPFAVSGMGLSTDSAWVATASTAGDIRLIRNTDMHVRPAFRNRLIQFGNVTKLVWFLVLHRYKGDYAVRDMALSVPPHAGRPSQRNEVSIVALTDAGRALLWRRPGPFGKQLSSVDKVAVPGTYTAVATHPVTQEVWIAGASGGGPSGLGIFELTSSVVPCRGIADGLSVSAMVWNASGTRLALGLRDGSIRILTKAPGRGCGGTATEFDIPAHTTAVSTLSWYEDKLASGASDGTARLWKMPDGEEDRRLLTDVSRLSTRSAVERTPATDTAQLDALLGQIEARLSRLPSR